MLSDSVWTNDDNNNNNGEKINISMDEESNMHANASYTNGTDQSSKSSSTTNNRIFLLVIIMVACTALGTPPGNILGSKLNRRMVAGVSAFFLLLFVLLHGTKTYIGVDSLMKLIRRRMKWAGGDDGHNLLSSMELIDH